MFTPLPRADEFNGTTSEERIAALSEARRILAAGGGLSEAFVGKGTLNHDDAIELADYILTGHKYSDTHDFREEHDTHTMHNDIVASEQEPAVTVHVIQFEADVTGMEPEDADVVLANAAEDALKRHMKRDRKRAKKQAEQDQ